jgi:hypothetical protein
MVVHLAGVGDAMPGCEETASDSLYLPGRGARRGGEE